MITWVVLYVSINTAQGHGTTNDSDTLGLEMGFCRGHRLFGNFFDIFLCIPYVNAHGNDRALSTLYVYTKSLFWPFCHMDAFSFFMKKHSG